MKLAEETWVEIIYWKKLPLNGIQICVSGEGNVVLSWARASQRWRPSAATLTSRTRMHRASLARIRPPPADVNTTLPSRGLIMNYNYNNETDTVLKLLKTQFVFMAANIIIFIINNELCSDWLIHYACKEKKIKLPIRNYQSLFLSDKQTPELFHFKLFKMPKKQGGVIKYLIFFSNVTTNMIHQYPNICRLIDCHNTKWLIV